MDIIFNCGTSTQLKAWRTKKRKKIIDAVVNIHIKKGNMVFLNETEKAMEIFNKTLRFKKGRYEVCMHWIDVNFIFLPLKFYSRHR